MESLAGAGRSCRVAGGGAFCHKDGNCKRPGGCHWPVSVFNSCQFGKMIFCDYARQEAGEIRIVEASKCVQCVMCGCVFLFFFRDGSNMATRQRRLSKVR